MKWIVFAVIILLGFFALTYNRFVALRNLMKEAWSGIDVQLKQRQDLIPNLVEVVKSYAAHEQTTLEEVVRLRGQAQAAQDVEEQAGVERTIGIDMKRLLALAESYPDLKADKNFRELQAALTEIEDKLQYARRYYNGTVRNLNTLAQSFPANLIASLCNIKQAKFFELEYATPRQAPDIDFD